MKPDTIRAWRSDDTEPKQDAAPDPVIAKLADGDPAALAFAAYLAQSLAGWRRKPRNEF